MVAEKAEILWSDEVQERLQYWADWARGNQLIRLAGNILASEIQRAAGVEVSLGEQELTEAGGVSADAAATLATFRDRRAVWAERVNDA